MEQVVLGIFQEQLSKVIVGFRKEQINANILNGKGEIRDVSLNCQMLNEALARLTPYIELEEIHVSRLGFHVTSWTNLRKAPIIVDIGNITAKVQEPLRCLPRHERRKLQMITEAELIAKMLTEGFKPLRAGKGSYGLVDRIVDNMTIEMESFTLEYQTWGKFKTQRIGAWTPPALIVKATNLKVVMVDEEGNEGTPDQVWSHNLNQRETFMLYKKVSGECQMLLRPNENHAASSDDDDDPTDNSSSSSLPLKLAETKMEVQMAVQRRLRDGAILAVQMDVTLPSVDATIDIKGVHELAHFAAGLQYCFAKDRSFDDPLRSKAESDANKKEHASDSAGPTIRMMSRVGTTEEEDEEDDDDNNNQEKSGKDASLLHRDRANTGDDSVQGAVSIENTSADADSASVTSWQSEDDRSLVSSNNNDGRSSKSGFGSMSSSRHAKLGSNRPVIILPNSMVIYKSFSFTCAVHDLSVRGFYPHVATSGPSKQDVSGNDDDGYIEFLAKGCVTEIIWPKVDNEPGFYAQLSASFLSLQERFMQRKRTILLGGMQRDDHLSLHLPSGRPQEVGADEFFPLFERRGIRDDPMDLRHLFPTQAVGLKTTIDALKHKVASDNDTLGPEEVEIKYKVLHEMGVDEMDIVVDTAIFHRMARFFLCQDGKGFDPRWHTGDWTDLLTAEMLHHPSEVLDLDLCLQEPKEVFLDEHNMISSDLFNMTARLTNVEIKIPSAVHDNLRACDIAMKWKETTCVISSALPRTFLSGKIGNSITGDACKDSEKGVIDFPNDPSDICFQLDKAEDLSLRPVDSEVKPVSTFRLQLTVRGFVMNIVPTIPFCKALEPRKLLAISNSTAIFCFEGEPPHDDCNQIKITLFISILIHDLTINLDLDLLAGAVCTILYHKDTVIMLVDTTKNLFPPSPTATTTTELPHFDRVESSNSMGIKKNLKGRSILVRRHISQSRETGGLAIVFCMQQKNLSIRVWRQNVPVTSPLRDMTSVSCNQRQYDDGGLVDLLSLVDFSLKGFEVGVEFDFHVNEGRRTVLKSYLDSANLKLVDMEKALTNNRRDDCMIDFCCFGEQSSLPGELDLLGNGQQFAFRLEGKKTRDSQSWSLAADITSPSRVHLHAEAFKNVAILVLEALLLPSWSNSSPDVDCSCPFPQGTIGFLFHSLVQGGKDSESIPLASLSLSQITMEDSEEPVVERCLRAISKLVLPADLHVILLRCEIANFLLSIPSAENEEETKSLSLHLLQSDFISRFYPIRGSQPSEMETVLACKGTDWSTLIDRQDDGFFQKMMSRQALLAFIDADPVTLVDTVVHPFELNLIYSSASIDVCMSEGLKIDDIRRIESFQSRLKAAIFQSTQCLSDLSQVAKSMKKSIRVETQKIAHSTNSDKEKTVGCEIEGSNSISTPFCSSKLFLQKASEELLLYEEEVRSAIWKRDNELESLKIALFQKERERFGAVALMSSRVAGWLKMGGQHHTGQRVAKKSLVWPYWTVLRKELLIMYPSPGVTKPVDIVSLVNARIRQLAGGKSKQDIKSGFAIIERNGMTRYFVARNAPEFSLWTKEITNSIRMCSDPSTIAAMDEEALAASAVDVAFNADIDNGDPYGGSEQKRGLGNRLASSFQSAKLKAKEMSERRVRTESTDSLEGFDEEGSYHGTSAAVLEGGADVDHNATSKRAQFGKKFSGVGQATKIRLGSAIQSARQKGAEISIRRTKNDGELNSEHSPNTTSNLLLDPEQTRFSDQGPRKRLQLGNKLGSVIQNAKTSRLSGIRDKIGGIAQRHEEPGAEPIAYNSSLKQSYWTCEKCSFINSSNGPCEMCGSSQEMIQSGDVPASPVRSQPMLPHSISQGALSDISETSQVIPENDHRSFARSASFEQSHSRRGPRFGFQKRQDTVLDDSVFGGDSSALKNVSVSKLGFPDITGTNRTLAPLKRLEGRWTVIVSNILFENASISQDITTNNDPTSEILSSLGPTSDTLYDKAIPAENDPGRVTASTLGHVVKLSSKEANIVPSEMCDNPLPRQHLKRNSLFHVSVYRTESVLKTPSAEKQLTRGEVLKFFSEISETIEAALPQLFEDETFYEEASNNAEFPSLKYKLAEKVLIFGRLLGGLLECEHSNELLSYQCECIQGFLNSLLDCPLPIDALCLLSETLCFSASTTDVSTSGFLGKERARKEQVEELSRERPAKILSFLSACQSEMQRIETSIVMEKSKQHNHEETYSSPCEDTFLQEVSRPVCYHPLLPPSLTTNLHESVQKVLLNITAERDEANAQLIGSNVMHIHSLERERKKNAKLEAELKMREEVANIQVRTDLNQPNLATFFGGKPDDRMAKMRKEIDLKIEAFHQVYRSHATTDEEMTQLCTQLANEITTKTSYALEIERLKEASETERKTYATERNTMRQELRRAKELLAAEELKRSEAQKEADKWKALYEEANCHK